MRFFFSTSLAAACAVLHGCAAKVPDAEAQSRMATSRKVEQLRYRAVTSGEVESTRGAEVLHADPYKEFNPSAARFGRPQSVSAEAARTNEFYFQDRVRTKGFLTRAFTSKKAAMGDMAFATKAAPVKESWLSRLKARTKSYETREAMEAPRAVPVRAMPGGEKPFMVKGRRQDEFDAKGPAAQAGSGAWMAGAGEAMSPSWTGDLKELSIEDVKRLLNKN